MRIRMLQTTTGSYDGTHTKEYEIGQEYSVGHDLISKDLAASFLASNVAVEIQETEPREGQVVPHQSLHASSVEEEPAGEPTPKSPDFTARHENAENPATPDFTARHDDAGKPSSMRDSGSATKPNAAEKPDSMGKPDTQEKPNFPERPKK